LARTDSPDWSEYELIDAGDGEKLERFGQYTLIRPEPQAIWRRVLPDEVWREAAAAHFVRKQTERYRAADETGGGWARRPEMPDSWRVTYTHGDLRLQLRLALTAFGHVGVFPEQTANWRFVHDALAGWPVPQPRVLNLFAYTGAASLVARQAGAEVVHVDASRPGLNWANQNRQLNGLGDIHWVHEDALKFVRREVKRGNVYHGVIMDPPPYGRGPGGEKWTLAEKLDELVRLAGKLLDPDRHFLVLSLYAAGLSPTVGLNVVKGHCDVAGAEYGEFILPSRHGRDLPMGTFVRVRR